MSLGRLNLQKQRVCTNHEVCDVHDIGAEVVPHLHVAWWQRAADGLRDLRWRQHSAIDVYLHDGL